MGQLQDQMYKESKVVIRDVTAAQFAAQAVGAPFEIGIRYRVDGGSEYRWNGSEWVCTVESTTTLTGGSVISGVKAVFGDRQIPSLVGTQKLYCGLPALAAASISYMNNTPVFCRPIAAQIIYHNWTNAAVTLVAGALAASPNHTNDGTGLTWTQDPALPASVPVGVYNATPEHMVPGIAFGGKIPLTLVDRDDGGLLKLLQTRAHYPASQYIPQISAAETVKIRAETLLYGLGDISGNVSSTNRTNPILTLTPTFGIQYFPTGLKLYYDRKTITVGTAGDSRSMGYGSTCSYASPALLACCSLNSRQDKIIFEPLLYARGSQNHTASYNTGLLILASHKPNYLNFHAWTPNEAPTQGVMDRSWFDETVPLVQACIDVGTVPILHTSGAQNALDSTQNALRLAQNIRVRDLCASMGLPLVDEALQVDSYDTRSIITAMDSGDHLHFSQGYQIWAGEKIAAIVA